MLNKETAISKVKAFVDACKERNIFFRKVIIFGSMISGNIHEDSDIDVALVSDGFTGSAYGDWHILSPINIKFTDIEPHPFPTKYFEQGDPFIDEITRTGIEIEVN